VNPARVCRAARATLLVTALPALLRAQAPLAARMSPAATWRALWPSDSTPPAHWPHADSTLVRGLRWWAGQRGIRWAELPLRGDGEAWRTRGIIVHIDPAQVRIALDTAFTYRRDRHGAVIRSSGWGVESVTGALLAVNAGQFEPTIYGMLPWGWVVMNGREWQPPGAGPLSTAVVIDSAGRVALLPPDSTQVATRRRRVAHAFQSFPTLLDGDGQVPAALRQPERGVDLTHRDARLALGLLRDGTLLLVLTRFDLLGRAMGAIPFGLTTPEMSALMGALGCQRAVMLDGGISAQVHLRTAAGQLQRWPGWRRVPMGLVVRAR
jgi:hypothetical protein